MRTVDPCTLLAFASSALLACATGAPTRDPSAVLPAAYLEERPGGTPAESYALDLSPELEPQRERYRAWIDLAVGQVAQWFSEQGLELASAELVQSATILADRLDARRRYAQLAGIDEAEVPLHFSGAMRDGALIALGPELTQKRYRLMFQDYSWSDEEYTSVLAHEIAHAAHLQVAQRRGVGPQGTGPRWFYEGLAVACGAQFDGEPNGLLDPRTLEELIRRDARGPLRLPIYGQMLRSAAARFPIPVLLDRAGKPDFTPWLLASLRNERGDEPKASSGVASSSPGERRARPARGAHRARSRK